MSGERGAYAERDLAELADQVAAGEIDEATAARLRRRYEEDLTSSEAAPVRDLPAIPRRALLGTALVLAVFTGAILFVGRSDTPSEQGAAAGAARDAPAPEAGPGAGPFAEMEAALAERPEREELRLGLADAYFRQEDYSPALGHYLTLLEGDPAPAVESLALGRVGWMAFITNQTEAAGQYLERSVALDPENYEGKLYLGYVLFYGNGDGEAAVPLFEEVLAHGDLTPQTRDDVARALTAAREEGDAE